MMNEPKKDLLYYDIYVIGVFGRNRSVKRQVFKVAETPVDQPLTEEAVRKVVNEKITELKIKSGSKVIASFNKVTVEKNGAFTSTTFSPFDAQRLFAIEVA